MAKDTKLANKVDKRETKQKAKKPNIFVRFGRFCKDVWSELKRVVWPSRKDLLTYTLAVIAVVIVAAVVVFGLDSLFGAGMKLLVS